MDEKDKKAPETTSNASMAGPETQRQDIKYEVPLPEEGAPVYFGGAEYIEQHKDGFTGEELERTRQIAARDFDPHESGTGRVQDWSKGVPSRNQQGLDPDALEDVTTSSIIDDPTLGDKNRNRLRSGSSNPDTERDISK